MKPNIELTSFEMFQSATIGITRHINGIKNHRQAAHGYGNDNDWQIDIEGAMGECAVARYLGIYWNGSIGQLYDGDVGKYEVRTGSKDNYRLILNKSDRDDRIYILVTGTNGKYIIHGWVYGMEGKIDRYWEDPTGKRPAFFVPQSVLNSMETLPNDYLVI